MVEPKHFNNNLFKLNNLFNLQNTFIKRPSVAHSQNNKVILKAGTGASNHYICTEDAPTLRSTKEG